MGRMPRWAIWSLSALAFVAVAGGVAMIAGKGRKGEELERYVLDGERMNLRVTAYRETGFFVTVAGAFYVLECQTGSGSSWREIATFRHDDQITIPRDQLRAVNADVAYFYIGWIYAVTSDGGKSWVVWDAENDLPGWQPADYRFITGVELQPDGKGTMRVSTLRFPYDRLVTDDFGKTWRPMPS